MLSIHDKCRCRHEWQNHNDEGRCQTFGMGGDEDAQCPCRQFIPAPVVYPPHPTPDNGKPYREPNRRQYSSVAETMAFYEPMPNVPVDESVMVWADSGKPVLPDRDRHNARTFWIIIIAAIIIGMALGYIIGLVVWKS